MSSDLDEALAWLYRQTRGGGARGPARAAALLEQLSLAAPDNVIRVVGTNGKGSVTTMLAAGLSAQGHSTGSFLSPHVERFDERVAVDGQQVGTQQILEFVDLARHELTSRPPAAELRPSFFELTLALALSVFSAAAVTHAVLEAGVGGASDATSAVVGAASAATSAVVGAAAADKLRLVVLTNVDLDHTETLGNSIEEIAIEKAGAFGAGVPAVSGASGTALQAIRRVASERGSPLHVDDGRDPLFELPSGAVLEQQRAARRSTRLANARLAAAGLRLLGASESAVAAGLSIPPLAGRGERFAVAGRTVVLDGAHDPAAARRLVDDIAGATTSTGSGSDDASGERRSATALGGFVLLFGSLPRKQGSATLEPLAAAATCVVVTAVEPGDDLSRFAGQDRELIADPAAALRRAIDLTPTGGLLLVAGSLYLAGMLRPLLRSLDS